MAAKRYARSGEGAALRKKAGLSLAEMAREIDPPASVSTVFRWENGTEPHGDHAVAWAEILQALRREVGIGAEAS